MSATFVDILRNLGYDVDLTIRPKKYCLGCYCDINFNNYGTPEIVQGPKESDIFEVRICFSYPCSCVKYSE